MAERLSGRWFAVRPAHNRKPVTYRCPFCGQLLAALSAHLLVLPEGGSAGRRHAHTECVLRARRAGRLPTREEWQATTQPPPAGRTVGFLTRWRRRFGSD